MNILKQVLDFKAKYPSTIAWRLKQHCSVIEKHLNPDEVVNYAFACQKNNHSYEIFRTFTVAVTNKRLIIAQKRLLFGYFFISVTPDMYNDLTSTTSIIWGKICIDTIKEVITLSNIDKNAIPEIETAITSFMMENKNELNEDN